VTTAEVKKAANMLTPNSERRGARKLGKTMGRFSCSITVTIICLLWPAVQSAVLPPGHQLAPLLLLVAGPPQPAIGQFHPFALFDSLFNDLSASSPLRKKERKHTGQMIFKFKHFFYFWPLF
jgi:hypothetical protein